MRSETNLRSLLQFMEGAGFYAQGEGSIYFVGGASLLLLDVRDQTLDIDLRMDPEPPGIFEAISTLKESLGINIELASPDQFLPELPGWKDRSEFINRSRTLSFFHYDFYSQVLSKLLRAHSKDLDDVAALLRLGKVNKAKLWELFVSIEPNLIRFPAITPSAFRSRVVAFVEEAPES